MSVLIKGMKMPKCCDECDFVQHGNEDWCYITEQDLPCICPLIELPDHGDLIDRDALKAKSVFVGDAFTGTGGYAVWGNDLLDSPVVIPAERSEDGET